MRKWCKGSEKGFTLVELLVAIPIIGLLGLAMAGVLIQLLRSDRITQGMTAIRQVQAAGDRVSRDGVQAQSVTFGADNMTSPSWYLNLSWTGEWMDDSDDFVLRSENVTYTLVANGSWYELRRYGIVQMSVDGVSQPTHYSTSTVGRYLDRSQMSCQWEDINGDGELEEITFAFKVVSVVGTKTQERTYNITPRPQH